MGFLDQAKPKIPSTDGGPAGLGPAPQLGASGSKKQGPAPIGVPRGYVASHTTPPDIMDTSGILTPQQQALANEFAPGGFGTSQLGAQPQQVPARYKSGYEWLPASLKPDQIAQLQQAMIGAGILKSKGLLLGRWDAMSRNAFSHLLGIANASGMSWGDALKQYVQIGQQAGGGIGLDANGDPITFKPKPTLTVTLSNPDDLKRMFTATAANLMGHNLTDQEQQDMVQAYQNIQRWNQTTAFNAQQDAATNAPDVRSGEPNPVVTETQTPSAQTFAENNVRMRHPGDVQERQLIGPQGLADTFSSILSKWNG